MAVHETVQKAGADEIEHIFDDRAITSEFLDAAMLHHVTITPTLAVISAFGGRSSGTQLANDPRFAPYLLGWATGILKTKLPEKALRGHNYSLAQTAARALHEKGVTILAGTDAPNPGTGYGASLHAELLLLTESGLTPVEALRSATLKPARKFGLIDRARIEVGRRADLLLIEGDPSINVRATRNIQGVWKAGVKIDREAVAKTAAASRSGDAHQ